METQTRKLVDKVLKKLQDLPSDKRYLIGIAGIPGSGKTTLANVVAKAVNEAVDDPRIAEAISMDGYHLTRKQLSAMPNAEEAHARRGAAFTFDVDAYLDLVIDLRNPPTKPIVAPTFDHRRKDPRPGDVCIVRETRVVIVEGNYIALNEPLWKDAKALFDEVWFVEVDFEVARRRLRERHVRAGIVSTLEEGDKRASENDLVNGEEILDKRLPVDEIIQSTEDGQWVHE